MRKVHLNFLVDAVAFVAFLFLTTTGVLVRYVLPPGSGHFSSLWGMDRHEWGQIHFWVAIALMVALAFHLFLHWRWVVCVIKGRPSEASGSRLALAIVAVIALVGLSIAPFFAQIEESGEPPHKMRLTEPGETVSDQIDGSMTLGEVEQLTGVPAAIILQELGLPTDLPPESHLGRLRKEYEFEIHDVRDIVRKRREQQ